MFEASPGKRVQETPSQPMARCGDKPVILGMRGSKTGGWRATPDWDKK
jgi:hypothetical protein